MRARAARACYCHHLRPNRSRNPCPLDGWTTTPCGQPPHSSTSRRHAGQPEDVEITHRAECPLLGRWAGHVRRPFCTRCSLAKGRRRPLRSSVCTVCSSTAARCSPLEHLNGCAGSGTMSAGRACGGIRIAWGALRYISTASRGGRAIVENLAGSLAPCVPQ